MKISLSSRFYSNGWIVIVGLLTAGCASSPRLEMHHQGKLPPPGAFAFSGIESDERPSAWAAGLEKALEARGFQGADHPRYLVQIARSDRPGKVGLPVPEAILGRSEALPQAGNWTQGGAKRVRQVAFSISSASDGQEFYRLQGMEVYRPGKTDDGGVRLTEMMLDQIVGQ